MRNLWRRWRRPSGADAAVTAARHLQTGPVDTAVLRPGLVLRESEHGPVFRLDRRLRGADGRGYWILAEIDETGAAAPARRLVSEDRLGRWRADP